jgi:hypothetical protein
VLITRRSEDRLVLVTHPDHGILVGELAARWGSDRFAAPARRGSLEDAGTHHDDGWVELDGRPMYHADARRPAHFLEVPLPETVAPYARGIEPIHERDPYAGALVSMHWAGLYSTRWGMQAGPPVGHPAAIDVVAEQEARWIAALRAAWDGDGLRSAFEAGAWHDYELLQTGDFLSLHLSLADPEAITDADAPALPMASVLREVEQPPGARTVPNVPAGTGGAGRGRAGQHVEHVELTLTTVEPHVLRISPWPFASETFDVSLPARTLEDRPYASEAEAAAAYAAAPVEPLRWTLTA